jgi:GNAT superfamily N-acetyltransferase
MSAAITLATGDHMAQLLSLMSRRATEATGTDETDDTVLSRQHALKPLLAGGPEGAVWLVGPPRAPLGYVIVTFGWSVALGGREAWIEDVFVRPSVRRRGIGREVLHAIGVSLRQAEVRALQVRLPADQATAISFCSSAGFTQNPGLAVMTDLL